MENNLKDISVYFNEMYGGTVWPVPVQIKRGNGLPLDQTTVFQTLSDAQNYANGDAVSSYSPDGTLLVQTAAYRGQYIAVVPLSGDISAFVVNTDGTLTHLGTQSDIEKVDEKIDAKIKELDVTDIVAQPKKMIDKVWETDGKISVSFRDLTTNEVSGIDEYQLTSTLETWKNETGLSAAGVGEDTQIVLRKDIKGITGVMHFRGAGAFDDTLSNLATWAETSATLYANTTYYKSNVPTEGDFVIKTGDSTEFVFNGDSATGYWAKLGDEQLYLKKSEFETWRDTTLEDRLSTIETKETEISSKTDNKVKVGTYGSELQNKDSLSVVKILDEDYYKLIAEGKQDNDVLYVVSVDHLNGFDQRVTNVGNPLSATDAVNLSTMQYAVQQVKDSAISAIQINGQSFDIANNVASIQITCINCGGAF